MKVANAREQDDVQILKLHRTHQQKPHFDYPGLYWILGGNVPTAATAQRNTTLLYFALICCSNWYKREERELILPSGLNELYLTSILL